MPTVGVKRELLFKALGKKYSEYIARELMFSGIILFFYKVTMSLRSCALHLAWNWTKL